MNKGVTDTFYTFYKWIFVKEDESDFNQNNCVALNSVCGLGNSRPSLKSYDEKHVLPGVGNLIISALTANFDFSTENYTEAKVFVWILYLYLCSFIVLITYASCYVALLGLAVIFYGHL